MICRPLSIPIVLADLLFHDLQLMHEGHRGLLLPVRVHERRCQLEIKLLESRPAAISELLKGLNLALVDPGNLCGIAQLRCSYAVLA